MVTSIYWNSTSVSQKSIRKKIRTNQKSKMNFQLLFFVCAVLVVCDANNELFNSENASGVDCSIGKYHPHESYCDWYYECKDGKPIPVQCPTGLHFSVVLSSCVLPLFANCSVSKHNPLPCLSRFLNVISFSFNFESS